MIFLLLKLLNSLHISKKRIKFSSLPFREISNWGHYWHLLTGRFLFEEIISRNDLFLLNAFEKKVDKLKKTVKSQFLLAKCLNFNANCWSFIDCNLLNSKVFLKLKTRRNIFSEHFFSPIVSYLNIVAIILCDFFSLFNISCGNTVELLKIVFPICYHLRIEVKTMIQNSCPIS